MGQTAGYGVRSRVEGVRPHAGARHHADAGGLEPRARNPGLRRLVLNPEAYRRREVAEDESRHVQATGPLEETALRPLQDHSIGYGIGVAVVVVLLRGTVGELQGDGEGGDA